MQAWPDEFLTLAPRAAFLSGAEPDPIRLDDPELSGRRPVRQRQYDPLHQAQNCAFVLPLGSQHDNPGVPRGRIHPQVAEIQIERNQYATFLLRAARDHAIVRSSEAFIGYGIGFKARITEKNRAFRRQILVHLEFQRVCSKGSSAVPSRANSAAYPSAAWMSDSPRDG